MNEGRAGQSGSSYFATLLLGRQGAGGKSGLHKARYWLTARHVGSRRSVTESATENKPPVASATGKGETVG